MKRRLLTLLATGLLGLTPAAPTPLIAGSVHDQHGAPIEGAQIRGVAADGRAFIARTGGDGTFAIEASASSVTIECRFCQPERVNVGADDTVVAVVRRFDAIASAAPSSADVASVPYAHVESALSLAPFAVLNESKAPLPGPQISDHGLPGSGLLLDDGFANYDIVGGISPFYTIPQRYATSVSAAPQNDAYAYGNLAGSGTFVTGSQQNSGVALTGSDSLAHVAIDAGALSLGAGYSGDSNEQRSRADAQASTTSGTTTTGVALTSARGTSFLDDFDGIASSFNGARVDVERSGPADVSAAITFDRGSYDVDSPIYPASAAWSDGDARVEISSGAVVAPFAIFDLRRSSGFYTPATAVFSPVDTSLDQAQATAGVTARTESFDATAAFGGDNVSYTGDYPGEAAVNAFARDAVLQGTFRASTHWSIDASEGSSFRLPTFLELYGLNADNSLLLDRDATLEGALNWTDGRRLRAAFTALRRETSGLDNGTTASVGASFAWQVAPKISLRTWLLRITPDIVESPLAITYELLPRTADAGSAWLTYDNDGNLRVDLIWRRDLLDWQPNPHLDASISGPLSSRLRWYASSEQRIQSRATDIGLRW